MNKRDEGSETLGRKRLLSPSIYSLQYYVKACDSYCIAWTMVHSMHPCLEWRSNGNTSNNNIQ